ncbi:MAG: hypothetical protein HS104_12565 [Polyangiaceae bacterium]|nr:hypothetical protein [Polyangiaceae bacterium]MCL4752009.1 hypothetical protein [Myxococcales bacterium]
MKRSTRRLISYSALALGMSVLACGGDDGTSSSGGGGTGNVGAKGGTGGGGTGGVGNTGGGGVGNTGGGGTGGVGNTGGGGTGGGTGGIAGGGTGGGTGTDADGDGYDSTKDCDDTNKDVNPGATETCNGIDDNCDTQIDEGVTSTFYVDGDGDNYGVDNATSNKTACTAPTGYASAKGDCDDKDGAVYPGNTEVCDGKDNDCANGVDDGVTKNDYYNDVDGDGYGAGTATKACTPPGTTWVAQGGDCNDNDKAMFPGNPEICDSKDNDCNAATPDPGSQTWYQDSDGDGYGNQSATQTACAQPTGYVAASPVFDCKDNDKTINPQAIELCDGIDNNCVNGIDEGSIATYVDADGDGFGDSAGTVQYLCKVTTGRADNNQDCNDKNKAINPDATEIPGNSIDENCDGKDTSAGTLCGYKTYSATTLPDYFLGIFSTADKNTGGPMGANYYWEDHEISATAGQTFTIFETKAYDSAVVPRLYVNGPNSCTAGTLTSFAVSQGNPAGAHLATRVISNATAGYYVASATTAAANQQGYYRLDVVPGAVGTSCGIDSFRLWPHGMRVVDSMSTAGTVSPMPAGYIGDDIETYLAAGTTYTILQGGSAGVVDRIYKAAAGSCTTAIGTPATSGILNGGARLVYTPTAAGVYAFWAGANSTTYLGTAYSFNIVQGNVGESCFTGTAPAGGNGDAHVIWPLGGTVGESLAIGDRIGDILTTRFHDDFETYLEPGETINVTVTRTGGSAWTPRIYLTRAGACTSAVASAVPASGNVATLTYNVPATSPGIYTIVVTSSAASGTGTYTLQTSY